MTHGYEWFLEYDYVDMDDDFDFDYGVEDYDTDVSEAWSELDKVADEFNNEGDYDYDF